MVSMAQRTETFACLKDGSIVLPRHEERRGCSCCAQDADVLILAGLNTCEAFYFEEEYRRVFGDQPGYGSRTSLRKDGEVRQGSWIMALKEQLKKAITHDSTVPSRLLGDANWSP